MYSSFHAQSYLLVLASLIALLSTKSTVAFTPTTTAIHKGNHNIRRGKVIRKTPLLASSSAVTSSTVQSVVSELTEEPAPEPLLKSRRSVLQSLILSTLCISAVTTNPNETNAAPPIAIIAEELGYFPITNREGITQYVPARVKRSSTEQSVELAKFLSSRGVIMYGTYWCGHTSHQKQLFGREAWDNIQYVECSPKGAYYDANKLVKVAKNIDGYPTWYIPNEGRGNKGKGQWIGGEMPLERIAALSGYKGEFDVKLEGTDVSGSGSC